jgi:hypothetical protein
MSGTSPANITSFLDRDEWIDLMLASSLSTPAKVVVTALALRLNIDSGRLDISSVKLAKRINYSKRQVLRLISEAEATGWIKTNRNSGVANHYELMVPEEELTGDRSVTGDVENEEGTGDTYVTGTGDTHVTGNMEDDGGTGDIPGMDRCHPRHGPVTSDVTQTAYNHENREGVCVQLSGKSPRERRATSTCCTRHQVLAAESATTDAVRARYISVGAERTRRSFDAIFRRQIPGRCLTAGHRPWGRNLPLQRRRFDCDVELVRGNKRRHHSQDGRRDVQCDRAESRHLRKVIRYRPEFSDRDRRWRRGGERAR